VHSISMRSLGAAGALLAGISTALAQQAPAPAGAGQLEEIIVTARKQSENIQETPLSITAFGAEKIDLLGMKGVNDVAIRTPGMQYGNFSDLKLSPTSVRGVVASAGSAGQDPAVGMYVDEVFVGQGVSAAMDLYDIERVEVLRGPQGTLYGRNTVGGVISLTTKRPTGEFEGSAELQYGNYDQVRVGASVSGPIVASTLSGKLSGVYDDRSGTSDNVWLKIPANDKHHWAARGQLLFTPSESTELLLTGDYFKADQHPLSFETLKYNDEQPLPQMLDMFGLPRNTNPWDRKVYGNAPNQETLELWGVSAALKMRFGGVDFTSITAYRTHDYSSRDDSDRSPLDMAYDGDPEQVDTFSEELRFSWTSGSLEWLLGAYYFDHSSRNYSYLEVGQDLATYVLGNPGLVGLQTGSDGKLDTKSVAGFASVTWRASDELDFTLGGRYTHETKHVDYAQDDPLGAFGGTFAVKAHDSWSEFTPDFSARYRFAPDVMAYATISKGFKSGGYNDALGSSNGIAYDPETLWNYEAGIKSELMDRRVLVNVSLYYMAWDSIQLAQDNPTTPQWDPTILNAGKAHSQGIEAELQALVRERLRLGLNLSVQEAKYDEGTLPAPSGATPLKGNWIAYAPEYSGGLNADYSIPLAGGNVRLIGEALLRGPTYLTTDNQPDGHQDTYTLYNARVGYEPAGGKWSVFVWGKNLGDKTVMQRMYDMSAQPIIAQKFLELNDPLTYGLTLRLNF